MSDKAVDGCRACPTPDTKTTSEYNNVAVAPTPGKLTADPPTPRYPSCNVVSSSKTSTGGTGVTGGQNTTITNTQYVPGPPGPDGPKGWGFLWSGPWEEGLEYFAQSDEHPEADVVYFDGIVWVCLEDHTSDLGNAPYWAEDGGQFWSKWNNKSVTIPAVEKSILDKLKGYADDIWDWVENADLEDWLLAGAITAGVIWSGSALLDELYPDEEDVNRDQNASYNGSPGYSGTATAPSLKDVVISLCTYAGIPHNAADLSTEPCEFVISSNTQVRSILEQLSAAYQFDMIDSGGILKFAHRNTTIKATLTLEDMGFTSSTDIPTAYTAKRFQGITLPKSVSLTYISPDIDYNNFTQKTDLFTFEEGQDVNMAVPVVLTHEKAKEICETTLINAHLERMNYKFNTTYKFIHLEPGDCVDSPMGLIRIVKVEELEEGILEFEATDAGDAGSLVGTGLNVQLPTASNNTAKTVTMSGGLFIDPPVMDDADTSVRLFCAVHGFGKTEWTGAAVYMSTDNGASYKQVTSTTVAATVGSVSTPIPYAAPQTWDNTTEITVTLVSGSLISQSEIAVLNGANRCMVGQEVIGFCNAELISANTYKLTKLLRGRQGSELYCSTHAANELFVMLDKLVKIEFNDSDRGTTKLFKVVSIGADLSSVTGKPVQIMSNNTRMWTVHTPTYQLVGSSWKIFWQERVRFDNQIKDYATTNHDPDWGGYGIAVLNPIDDSVVRTATTTSTEWEYTNAMQVEDFGQLISHAKFSVVQMSTKWGGGYPTIINT